MMFYSFPDRYREVWEMLNRKEQKNLVKLIDRYCETRIEPTPKEIVGNVKYIWVLVRIEIDEELRKTEPAVIRRSQKYKEWRTAVFERDFYTCQICGEVGGRLNAHHIRPFSKYPELRLDVDNGITLCVDCHRHVHSRKDV